MRAPSPGAPNAASNGVPGSARTIAGTGGQLAGASSDARAAASAGTLLDVDNVTLRYRTPEAIITATNRVSFSVAAGDRFVLLGPSGCGKSTLLKAVGGYLMPDEGEIRIKGRAVQRPGADRMMVFQEFDQLLPWKTVLENVMFPLLVARKMPRKQAQERARAFVEKVHLGKFADSYTHTLSGGMKQRVAIARGMCMEPDILLMDEPFAALDALTRRQMQDELLQLWQETRFTVMFVTHSIAEAIRIGSRILLLSPHPGEVKAEVQNVEAAASDPAAAAALEQDIHDLLFDEKRTPPTHEHAEPSAQLAGALPPPDEPAPGTPATLAAQGTQAKGARTA